LTGDTWLKSIHHENACEMVVDKDLLEDTHNLARHFNLEIVGVDYMVGNNGEKYLLEVNHIPNVTIFPFMNDAFLEYAAHWVTNAHI
jgi:D-alanine-D-alanine ligase-like ATP-grasp enzyme